MGSLGGDNTSGAEEIGGAILHGGRLEAAALRYPAARLPWIDLSTGINPVGYPVPELPPSCFARLPEVEAVLRLEAVAARAYGVADAAMVVAAPGTQSLIDLLPRLIAARRVAVVGPTYAEHAASWARAERVVREISALGEAGEAEVVVVCQPNNPDGRVVPGGALMALADAMAARGGWLVVDEAFADLADGVGLAPALPHPAIVVLRSFGKTYGLAGVRLGFALAAPAMVGRVRAALGPWAVSGPAIAVGTLALGDRAWLAASREALGRGVARLDAMLERAGFDIIGGTLLFRLAASETAGRWFEHLAAQGILVRRFERQTAWLRFGIPADTGEWNRLDDALQQYKG
jgi:L-threonine-O-3-phosphate decarboxylase